MELIERYLESVKFWLPRRQKDDIIAELSDDIHAQVEEKKETALGRNLNEAEVEAILKQRGHPLLVANRFLPQESLIGPSLLSHLPFCAEDIRLRLPSACNAGVDWADDIQCYLSLRTYPSLVVYRIRVALQLLVVYHLSRGPPGHHCLCRSGEESSPCAFIRSLEPAQTPACPRPQPNPALRLDLRTGLQPDLLRLVGRLRALAGAADRLGAPNHSRPLMAVVLLGYLLVAAFNAAFACEKLLHPSWTVGRAAFRLLSDAAGAALFCWLMKAHIPAGITAANLPPERALAITSAINHWTTELFPWAIIVGLVVVATDLYRIVRLKLAASCSPA